MIASTVESYGNNWGHNNGNSLPTPFLTGGLREDVLAKWIIPKSGIFTINWEKQEVFVDTSWYKRSTGDWVTVSVRDNKSGKFVPLKHHGATELLGEEKKFSFMIHIPWGILLVGKKWDLQFHDELSF